MDILISSNNRLGRRGALLLESYCLTAILRYCKQSERKSAPLGIMTRASVARSSPRQSDSLAAIA